MFDDPLALSQQGLAAIPDEELATKINDALEAIKNMKEQGADTGVQEKVYEAYVAEYDRRSKSDAPTKPHGIKPVQ